MSVGALLLASGQAGAAAPFHSINQALALANHAAPPVMAPAAGVTAAKQALLGAQSLATAAARFRSLSDALAAAATTANPPVTDGLGAGGLDVLTGADGKPTAYTGATAPAQATGTYNVTIKQTQALAQLAWKTFNVGSKTHLTFDQTSGGSQAASWIAINSVQDPQANPSQILGSISAVGKVYILNRNGIAFGRGSTVNVGSLVAATADIAQSQFGSDANQLATFNLYGARSGATYQPTFVNGIATSTVTVAAGADIETAPATGTIGGGYVYLFGGNVTNAGAIGTPQGQAVLAAGTAFTLRPGSQGSTTAGNTTSTTLGSEVATLNVPLPSTDATGHFFASGTVQNSGIIVADRGDISLVGHAITQSGVLFSTTSVNTRGTIHLLTPTSPTDPTDLASLDARTSSIILAPNSVTEILPEDDGTTALDSQRAANIAASATLNAQRALLGTPSSTNPQLNNHSLLPDQFGESRIELSGGGTVDLQPTAIALTPGGQVAIGAASRVLVESGATIDVSGSTSAVLPSSVNDLLVNVQPYQLRDSAANRDGGLKSTNVYVDARTLVEIASGAYGPTAANPLGNIYTPGGLFEVGGYLGLIPHGINEFTAIGGQVTLQSQVTTGGLLGTSVGGEVITQPGSVINLTGGTVTYAAGPVHATYVQTTDGVVYNANVAPGNLVYTGLYTGAPFSQPRWQITENFVNPLLTPATTVDAGYVVGRDAGSLTVSAATAILQGSVPAGVTLGQNQTSARPANVSDPYLLAQNVVPLAGALQIGDYFSGALANGYASAVLFAAMQGPAGPTSISGTLAEGLAGTATIDAGLLNEDGFSRVTVTTQSDITVAAPIAVADGGAVSLAGSTIEANASITARGGAITLSNTLSTNGSALVAPLPSPAEPIDPAAPPAEPAKPLIALTNGAVLDARGVWTNAAQDPVHVAGEGLLNGGTVRVNGIGAVDLQAGTRIDVSSGGAILAGGRTLSGSGGNITVVADLYAPDPVLPVRSEPVSFDSAFVGFGSRGGGTISLTAPDFRLGTMDHTGLGTSVVVLGSAFFQSGFASYVIDGTKALSVLPGAQITVAEPIYIQAEGLAVPTGGDPSQAYAVALPPLFTPVRGGDTATQRAGASLTLLSDITPTSALGGGPVTIGEGASVAVDQGQSIVVSGHDRVTVFGTLTAHGGRVQVSNTRFDSPEATPGAVSTYVPGLSVWVGEAGVIDVSGQASLFTDPLGRVFGSVSSGGTIELGGYGGLSNSQSTWAQVIVRPGAVLDADGATATVDVIAADTQGGLVPQSNPVTLVSNGGTIVARSLAGVALDGTVTARAGGQGAAGGSLFLRIDPIALSLFTNIPISLYHPSEVLITQNFQAVQPDDLLYNQVTPDETFGLARLSQAQIDAGGFDRLSLSGGEILAFDGDVALHAGRSITLGAAAIGATSPESTASVTAPYVDITGDTRSFLAQGASLSLATASTTASLTVQADLLDLQDAISFGGTISLGSVPDKFGFPTGPAVLADTFGFATVSFGSTGDIRFLGPVTSQSGFVRTQGDVVFDAAQLYPVSGKATSVYAGVNALGVDGNNLPEGTITVLGRGGVPPQAPYSVGGALTLTAAHVVQDGVIRAPEGRITIGFDGVAPPIGGGAGNFTASVVLGAGSVTSVSLAGQTIPYGGTVDGVNYPDPLSPTVNVSPFAPTVELDAQSVNIVEGSTVDLSGGGTLSGAGFIVGRGGSADVLLNPLLAITGGSAVATGLAQTAAIKPSGGSDPVYAILPSYQSAYAPATGAVDQGYSPPAIGAQITVGTEVPGLAAGTYTLLPAYYALQPGGFRVELTSTTLLAGSQVALGNFSTAAPVISSTANTGIAANVPLSAIFTSSADVRKLSQYNEESYNTYLATTGTQFGAPRPFLPQDAKTLLLRYPAEIAPDAFFMNVLRAAPGAVLSAPDAKAGGYGLTVEVTSVAPIDITGPGDLPRPGRVAIPADALDSLTPARLVIGGIISVAPSAPGIAEVTARTSDVAVLPNARLVAGDVILTTSAPAFQEPGSITVEPGATITTIGAGPAAYDSSQGFYFRSSFPVIDVSNGQQIYVPANPLATAPITIGDGASLLAGGSLNFIAPVGSTVAIGAATLGAKYASIAVGAINIGTLPDGSGVTLPTGLNLDAALLETLLNGNAALGTPALQQLALTATQQVNFLGSAVVDTATTALVLNTPAIYGYGNADDTATIIAPSFTWNGVGIPAANQTPATSTLPGGQIEGSADHVTGSLLIQAPIVTFGYGPQTQPDAALSLDRLLVGFANVTVDATTKITANNQSTLAVYAQKSDFTRPGMFGELTLASPLITADPAAVFRITAGGSLSLASALGTLGSPAATGTVTTLGGEIDLTATAIAIDTSVALPTGRLTATADAGITFGADARIDLSGRDRAIFDQAVHSAGGTLVAETASGDISADAASVIDVSATGTRAGAIALSAQQGSVLLDGSVTGTAAAGSSTGSISVITGTLADFAGLNAKLDAGGFFASRAFEVSTGDLAIAADTVIRAQKVSIAADSGSIDIAGRIDASGNTPGSISIAAGQNLTLEAGAMLDAHAMATAVDSYGQPIDAENRAHVTLTAAAGTLTLAGGTIDVSYPGQDATNPYLHPNGNPQGQVVLNAPRLGAVGDPGYGDVALAVTGTPAITGAASIALYGTAIYHPTDPNGTIGQDASPLTPPGATLTLAQIDADSTAFIAGFNSGFSQRLGGLAGYGAAFHVRPGVIIESAPKTPAAGDVAAFDGNLTITGDLDFSSFRYDAGPGYGTAKTGALGSGEPGSIVFRAENQLIVNGSVSDGFAPPPDGEQGNYLTADAGWVFESRNNKADPLGADIILPSSVTGTTRMQGVSSVTHEIFLGGSDVRGTPATSFAGGTGAGSLNYGITIRSATITANRVIPFPVTLDTDLAAIPLGGWVATAPITDASGNVLFAQGAIIPGNTVLGLGVTLGAGTVLPVDVQTRVAREASSRLTYQQGTFVPAGTSLDIFSSSVQLSEDAALPVNALIPAGTAPVFVTAEDKHINRLDYRPVVKIGGKSVQGRLYALSDMLPADSLSWDLGFVAGANEDAANDLAVLPKTVLDGGALSVPSRSIGQSAGSLIIDDQHYYKPSGNPSKADPAFSVIRTGTGNLSLVAGGDFEQPSLFGIYTAGTQTSLGSPEADAPYNTPRNAEGDTKNAVLPGNSRDVQNLNTIIKRSDGAYYANDGGDVLVAAQGNLSGDLISAGNAPNAPESDGVGNWLWRQGGEGLDQPGAWWIDYGTVVNAFTPFNGNNLQLIGFQGIGALGGGNVTVIAGGDAGGASALGRDHGLVVAVGGTGRVLASGDIVLTGGGTETVQVGGDFNATGSDLINVRGDTTLVAGAVGSTNSAFGTGAYDPRALDPFQPYDSAVSGGPVVVPGDGTVDIESLRALSLTGAGDPGRVVEQSFTRVSDRALVGSKPNSGGQTGFSLWTGATSISLFSAGGDVTPITASGIDPRANNAPTGLRFQYPPTLLVTAATGSIAYGADAVITDTLGVGLETAPSADGEISFLAGTSVFGNGFAIDMSGAPLGGLPTPFDPTYNLTGRRNQQRFTLSNERVTGLSTSTLDLFAQEADTPVSYTHAGDTAPLRFYAAGGDIVNLVNGQTVTFSAVANEPLGQWYIAAKPARILASNDIVSSGTRPTSTLQGTQQNQQNAGDSANALYTTSGDVFLNTSSQAISVVSAGRDILSGYFYVGGPGLLEVDAGRNLFQGGYTAGTVQVLEFGAIRSLGPVLAGSPASLSGGADVAVLAGIGSSPAYAAFEALYLDPANQANLALPLTDPANAGKVQLVYTDQLTAWLTANHPELSQANGALAAFDTLPQVERDIFLRQVFFDETLAGGRQYNDPTSRFFGSYTRGRQAIDTLFPSPADTETAPGVPAGYVGAITMLSGPITIVPDRNNNTITVNVNYDAGISSAFGGTIQVLDPGGQVLLGTAGGPAPGGGSGIITNGTGDIDVYARDSVLLGKSRVFTTAGGSILVWSSQGDINAGIGARTTQVFTPPVLTYDDTGGTTQTPAVPTNGAGIATLAPLPGIAAGDVDLIAPLGTIDAGEAGIRVSGNLNLAAARLANTANISVGGKTSGNAAPASVSLGSVEAAGAAAGAASNAAQNTSKPKAAQEQPSIIEVDVIGVSGGQSEEERRKRRGL